MKTRIMRVLFVLGALLAWAIASGASRWGDVIRNVTRCATFFPHKKASAGHRPAEPSVL